MQYIKDIVRNRKHLQALQMSICSQLVIQLKILQRRMSEVLAPIQMLMHRFPRMIRINQQILYLHQTRMHYI